MTNTVNAATIPLRGRHLIEASAGTGKTFTVANLYLRLLIDARDNDPPTVEEILVVTFTIAATEELRARLRERLTLAIQELDGESADTDPTLGEVLDPHRTDPKIRDRLDLALQSMDQAAIFTIHGFCDRVLREQAFESGELFDAELQAELESLRLLAAESWWRNFVTPMSAVDTDAIPIGWRSPSGVLNRLSSIITDPSGELVPQATEDSLKKAETAYRDAWPSFRQTWHDDGADWSEVVRSAVASSLINKDQGKYTTETVFEMVEHASVLAQNEDTPVSLKPNLAILGNRQLTASKSKRKKDDAPESADR